MFPRTVVFLLIALVGGVFFGYAGRFVWGNSSAKHLQRQESSSNSLRAVKSHFQGEGRKGAESELVSLLDRELIRISVMRPEAMLQELEKRGKNSGNRRFNLVSDSWVIDALCYRLGRTAPLQTLQMVNKLEAIKDHGILPLLDSWSYMDPKSAYAYCQNNLGRDSISFRWFKGDILSQLPLEQGLKVLCMDKGWEQGRTLEIFIEITAWKYPEKIPELVKRFGSNWGNVFSREDVAVQWMNEDSAAARQWIETFPKREQESILFRALSNQTWEKCVQALSRMPEEEQNRALNAMGMSLFREDTVRTLKWLQENKDEKRAVQVLEREFDTNNVCDPKLNEYVNEMKEGELKDALLGKMVKKMTGVSWGNSSFLGLRTEDIVGRILQIQSTEKKQKAFKDLMWGRFMMDSGRGKRWTEKARLGEEDKKMFIELCDGFKNEWE